MTHHLNSDNDEDRGFGLGRGQPEGLFFPLLFGLITLLCHVTAGGLGWGIGAAVKGVDLADAERLVGDGDLFAVAALLSSLGFLVCIHFTRVLAPGHVERYLHIRNPPRRAIVWWTLLFVVFMCLSDLARVALNYDVVPDSILSTWQTCGPLVMPAYIVTILVFVPVGEELFFRGFLFEGIRRSYLGSAGAILITSAIWAALHLQYELFDIALLLIMGIFLAVVRLKTKSLLAAIWLHSLNNAVSLLHIIVTARVVEMGGGQ